MAALRALCACEAVARAGRVVRGWARNPRPWPVARWVTVILVCVELLGLVLDVRALQSAHEPVDDDVLLVRIIRHVLGAVVVAALCVLISRSIPALDWRARLTHWVTELSVEDQAVFSTHLWGAVSFVYIALFCPVPLIEADIRCAIAPDAPQPPNSLPLRDLGCDGEHVSLRESMTLFGIASTCSVFLFQMNTLWAIVSTASTFVILASVALRGDPGLVFACLLWVFVILSGRFNIAAMAVSDRMDLDEKHRRVMRRAIAGVSHEVRSPLNTVLAGAGDALRDVVNFAQLVTQSASSIPLASSAALLRIDDRGRLHLLDSTLAERILVQPSVWDALAAPTESSVTAPLDLYRIARRLGEVVENGRMIELLHKDLLDVDKLQRGEVAVQPVPTLIAPLLPKLARYYIKQKSDHIRFRVVLDPRLPRCAVFDELRVLQILRNGLSNAIKVVEVDERLAVKRAEEEAFQAELRLLSAGEAPHGSIASVSEAASELSSAAVASVPDSLPTSLDDLVQRRDPTSRLLRRRVRARVAEARRTRPLPEIVITMELFELPEDSSSASHRDLRSSSETPGRSGSRKTTSLPTLTTEPSAGDGTSSTAAPTPSPATTTSPSALTPSWCCPRGRSSAAVLARFGSEPEFAVPVHTNPTPTSTPSSTPASTSHLRSSATSSAASSALDGVAGATPSSATLDSRDLHRVRYEHLGGVKDFLRRARDQRRSHRSHRSHLSKTSASYASGTAPAGVAALSSSDDGARGAPSRLTPSPLAPSSAGSGASSSSHSPDAQHAVAAGTGQTFVSVTVVAPSGLDSGVALGLAGPASSGPNGNRGGEGAITSVSGVGASGRVVGAAREPDRDRSDLASGASDLRELSAHGESSNGAADTHSSPSHLSSDPLVGDAGVLLEAFSNPDVGIPADSGVLMMDSSAIPDWSRFNFLIQPSEVAETFVAPGATVRASPSVPAHTVLSQTAVTSGTESTHNSLVSGHLPILYPSQSPSATARSPAPASLPPGGLHRPPWNDGSVHSSPPPSTNLAASARTLPSLAPTREPLRHGLEASPEPRAPRASPVADSLPSAAGPLFTPRQGGRETGSVGSLGAEPGSDGRPSMAMEVIVERSSSGGGTLSQDSSDDSPSSRAENGSPPTPQPSRAGAVPRETVIVSLRPMTLNDVTGIHSIPTAVSSSSSSNTTSSPGLIPGTVGRTVELRLSHEDEDTTGGGSALSHPGTARAHSLVDAAHAADLTGPPEALSDVVDHDEALAPATTTSSTREPDAGLAAPASSARRVSGGAGDDMDSAAAAAGGSGITRVASFRGVPVRAHAGAVDPPTAAAGTGDGGAPSAPRPPAAAALPWRHARHGTAETFGAATLPRVQSEPVIVSQHPSFATSPHILPTSGVPTPLHPRPPRWSPTTASARGESPATGFAPPPMPGRPVPSPPASAYSLPVPTTTRGLPHNQLSAREPLAAAFAGFSALGGASGTGLPVGRPGPASRGPTASPSITRPVNWSRACLVVRILDSGPGFGDVDPETLFRGHVQVGDRQLQELGNGIGLSECRKLARRMGAEVRLNRDDSYPTADGRARTCFWFALPLTLPPREDEEDGEGNTDGGCETTDREDDGRDDESSNPATAASHATSPHPFHRAFEGRADTSVFSATSRNTGPTITDHTREGAEVDDSDDADVSEAESRFAPRGRAPRRTSRIRHRKRGSFSGVLGSTSYETGVPVAPVLRRPNPSAPVLESELSSFVLSGTLPTAIGSPVLAGSAKVDRDGHARRSEPTGSNAPAPRPSPVLLPAARGPESPAPLRSERHAMTTHDRPDVDGVFSPVSTRPSTHGSPTVGRSARGPSARSESPTHELHGNSDSLHAMPSRSTPSGALTPTTQGLSAWRYSATNTTSAREGGSGIHRPRSSTAAACAPGEPSRAGPPVHRAGSMHVPPASSSHLPSFSADRAPAPPARLESTSPPAEAGAAPATDPTTHSSSSLHLATTRGPEHEPLGAPMPPISEDTRNQDHAVEVGPPRDSRQSLPPIVSLYASAPATRRTPTRPFDTDVQPSVRRLRLIPSHVRAPPRIVGGPIELVPLPRQLGPRLGSSELADPLGSDSGTLPLAPARPHPERGPAAALMSSSLFSSSAIESASPTAVRPRALGLGPSPAPATAASRASGSRSDPRMDTPAAVTVEALPRGAAAGAVDGGGAGGGAGGRGGGGGGGGSTAATDTEPGVGMSSIFLHSNRAVTNTSPESGPSIQVDVGDVEGSVGRSLSTSVVEDDGVSAAQRAAPAATRTVRVRSSRTPTARGGGGGADPRCIDVVVWMADDERSMRLTLLRALTQAGVTPANVVEFEDGNVLVDAWEDAEDGGSEAALRLPHIIFCDVHMPIMSGPEVVDRLRKRGCSIPIVAVTGRDQEEDVAELRRAGFTLVLGKQSSNLTREVLLRVLADTQVIPPQ